VLHTAYSKAQYRFRNIHFTPVTAIVALLKLHLQESALSLVDSAAAAAPEELLMPPCMSCQSWDIKASASVISYL
jgi:hypothetical protein